jgi:hypothetical protein
MGKRKNIMACWKEFNPSAGRSMKEDFSEESSPLASRIIAYLDSGEVILASPSRSVDVFSGEMIGHTKCIRTDGTFSWSDSLSYYVRKYNLRLPAEFLDKILDTQIENYMEK